MGVILSRLPLSWTTTPRHHHLPPSHQCHAAVTTTPSISSLSPYSNASPQNLLRQNSTHQISSHQNVSTTSAPASTPAPTVAPQVHTAETALIQLLANTKYRKYYVTLPSGIRLNTITTGPPTGPTLILLHGWGAGTAFFAKNILSLSQSMRLHLIDWPGFGTSDRPTFDPKWSPLLAEQFFVDAFLSWVSVMPKYDPSFPPNFHIVAHSLGAYLATVIALRAPHLVRNLVLVSPVGLPPPPPVKIPQSATFLVRVIFRTLFTFWDAGFTPQMLIRMLGPRLGRRLAKNIILPRLVIPDCNTQQALSEYFYQISNAPCSAELALSTILESGAYARNPLCYRLPRLTVPVTFLYGDRDWMSKSAAHDVCLKMSVPTQIIIIPNAGHHLYFDNPDSFNEAVLKACARFAPTTASPDQISPV